MNLLNKGLIYISIREIRIQFQIVSEVKCKCFVHAQSADPIQNPPIAQINLQQNEHFIDTNDVLHVN